MQLEVLQHVHADGDLRGDLDTGAAQFGVAHGGVHVAHLQKRAGNAHGEVETGALGDELVVHVAAVVAHEAVNPFQYGLQKFVDAHEFIPFLMWYRGLRAQDHSRLWRTDCSAGRAMPPAAHP